MPTFFHLMKCSISEMKTTQPRKCRKLHNVESFKSYFKKLELCGLEKNHRVKLENVEKFYCS